MSSGYLVVNLEQRRAPSSPTRVMWVEQKTCHLDGEHEAASVKIKHFQIQKAERFTLESSGESG